jgi:hypothetical protein
MKWRRRERVGKEVRSGGDTDRERERREQREEKERSTKEAYKLKNVKERGIERERQRVNKREEEE